MQWVTSGYLVAFAASLPVCSWLGKKIGAGRLWLAALAVFTATSGLCAAAPGIDPLIALGLAQGLAAGLLIPAGQTILGQAIALAAVPPGIAAYKTVRPSQLPDATTQVNIVQRVGGALGGALFTVIFANGLSHGAGHAFHATFWWLTGTAILALGSAAALQVTLTLGRRLPGGPADPPLCDQRAQG
ncbi:MAG TPA: hypothetical protein VE733_13145 [Streptosporangiaceae bacterium]|nr:hypothetical protein [Streptosporangiaceae bacterium]